MVKISHLQQIHNLKSYRNACRIVKQLENYTSVSFHNKHKVVYLNKAGRELIGSDKEIKKTSILDHMLYCNEAYIDLKCPLDWRREVPFVVSTTKPSSLEIKVNGLSRAAVAEKRIIADAAFSRNGYEYMVEIDNTRTMLDNAKKMNSYSELFRSMNKLCKLLIYTTTDDRKRKFEKMILEGKVMGEVKTFSEIRHSS